MHKLWARVWTNWWNSDLSETRQNSLYNRYSGQLYMSSLRAHWFRKEKSGEKWTNFLSLCGVASIGLSLGGVVACGIWGVVALEREHKRARDTLGPSWWVGNTETFLLRDAPWHRSGDCSLNSSVWRKAMSYFRVVTLDRIKCVCGWEASTGPVTILCAVTWIVKKNWQATPCLDRANKAQGPWEPRVTPTATISRLSVSYAEI